MLNLLRKLRRTNMKGKYLKYALGEIILVVIGILIALSLNNWNEQRKASNKRQNYRLSLIEELEFDLRTLDRLDSTNHEYIHSIEQYLEYYESGSFRIDSLILKMKQVRSVKNFFNSSTFTIDDLLFTGNLQLFSPTVRKAIMELRQSQQLNGEYERKNADELLRFESETIQHIDLVFEERGQSLEHSEVRGWKSDINSKQYRLKNNQFLLALNFHKYQLEIHERMRKKTQGLLGLLKTTN